MAHINDGGPRELTDAERIAFVAGWDAYRDSLTESGPCYSLSDAWDDFRARAQPQALAPRAVQDAHIATWGEGK